MSGVPDEVKEFFSVDGNDLLLVKGEAGSGKTIFSLECLVELARKGYGFYFSTRVDIESLLRQYPWIREQIPIKNVVDATASSIAQTMEIREAIKYSTVPEFLRGLYAKIDKIKDEGKPFIVVDSVDAVCERIEIPDSKFVHTFADFVRKTGSKAIIVTERSGKTKLDYLVDGVVSLTYELIDGRVYREMHIEKLRSVKIKNPIIPFTLIKGRFTITQFVRSTMEDIIRKNEKYVEEISKIKVPPGLHSTGFPLIDEIIGHIRKGNFILYEVEPYVPKTAIVGLMSRHSVGLVGRGHVIIEIPPAYGHLKLLSSTYRKILKDKAKMVKILFPETMSPSSLEGKFLDLIEEVSTNKKPSAILFSFDVLELNFGVKEAYRIGRRIVTEGRKSSNMIIAFIYENSKITPLFRNMADNILKIFYRDGYLFIYGIHPKTPIYNITYSPKEVYVGVDLLEIS
ncbi:MAG: gas vesicle protein GvpD P-loop domain-containing protein [Candidatus Asgardarchaeia archaeon]